MVRCCVPHCESDSFNNYKYVTFHEFPHTTVEQTSWLSVMNLSQAAVICSEHFDSTDFMNTQDGRVELKHDAVPKIQICIICLQSNTKLIDSGKHNLENVYKTVTGININENAIYRNKFCVECSQRLLNCHVFKEKCTWANSLLADIIRDHKHINKEILAVLHIEQARLKSNLGFKHFEPDYCDAILNHDDILISKLDEITNSDIKFEEKIQFESIQTDIKHENNEIVLEYDQNDVFEQTRSDYSTDDDLTLKQIEQKKIKAKKKRNVVKRKKEASNDETPKVDRRRKPLSIDGVNENLFTIISLSVEEQKQEILKRQDSVNFKNSPLKCMDCYKGFQDKKAYSTHMLRHSDEFGPYACTICKARFKTLSKVTKHKTAIHCFEYRCNQCNFITTNRQSAKLHEGWHRGKIYKCSQCTDVFIKFTTYMGHLRIKHPSDFVCELCGYAFVSVKGITLHKKLKHLASEKVPEDGPFCETCNVRFISEEALMRHLNVSARHKNESNSGRVLYPNRPPQISIKTTKKRVKSDDLMDANFTSQDLTCEQCGMEMRDSRAYHLHFRKMHPDKNRTLYPSMKTPCMCDKCGKIFQSYALLKDHFHTHTNERRFKCTQCDKTFRMKQRLTTHMGTHKQQRYPCHVCGKSFSNVGNRQRHMIIHTGLRPHKCEMCSKTFKTSTEKKTHVNYVHLKKPWPKRSRGRRNRQGQNIQSGGGASETDVQTWPPCEKLMMSEKPAYYDLKI